MSRHRIRSYFGRFLLLLLLLFPYGHKGTALLAQAAGQVRIISVPDQGLRYLLDDKYFMTERQLTLSEGDHRFIFWAPEHQMLDTQVFVMGDYTINLNIRLQRPPEYVEHRAAVDRFHQRQRMGRVVPPLVSGGLGIWAAVSTLRYGRAHSALKDLRAEYETSSDPGRIQAIKTSDIPEARDHFRSMRNQTYISSGLFVVSLGTAVYIRRQMAQKRPPVYEDQERLRFEGLVYVPGPGGGTWATGITFAIR